MKVLLSFFLCSMLFLSFDGWSQTDDPVLSGEFQEKPLKEVLDTIEAQFNVKFNYIKQIVDTTTINASFKDEPLMNALEIMLDDKPLRAEKGKEGIVLTYDIHKKLDVKRYTIMGEITDYSGRAVENVKIQVQGLKKSYISDSLGFYKLDNLKEGNVFIKFQRSGYYPGSEGISLDDDVTLNVNIKVKTKPGASSKPRSDGQGNQNILGPDQTIELQESEYTLGAFLNEISERGQFAIVDKTDRLPKEKIVRISSGSHKVSDLLDEAFEKTSIEFIAFKGKVILRNKKPNPPNHTISGTVKDSKTGEAITGVSILVKGTTIGATSNQYGFYSLTLPEWDYVIFYSSVGFKTTLKEVSLEGNTKLNVALYDDFQELEEVVVIAENPTRSIDQIEMGTLKMDMKKIKNIPAFLGEVDVVKSLFLQPGVTTVGEGAAGFNVRGGGIDQNLVILDEAPVYNSSHLFGFFSVFNPDAVRDVKLYKSGIPAKYGGRLSSVLDVTQKEGNNQKFTTSGGIGVVGGRLAIEGPLVKDKSSFIVAGRRSFIGSLLKNIDELSNTDIYFYDVNAKVNYKINDRNRVFLSAYLGKDYFELGDENFLLDWGNSTATVRWNHLFGEKLFSNFTGVYSNYYYRQGSTDPGFEYIGDMGIKNYNAKAEFTYFVNPKHTLDFGLNSVYYQFETGNISPQSEGSAIVPYNLQDDYAIEPSVYMSDEYRINESLKVVAGLRYSHYFNIGKGDVYTYQSDAPKEISTILDTIKYGRGDIIQQYGGIEPRLALNYKLSDNSSVQASYDRMRQNIHLVTNTIAATPLDIWKASDQYIKPQISDQFSIGYFRNFKDNMFEGSLEVYYKDMQNVVDFKDGADLVLNKAIETDLLAGVGRAYGAEFQISKTSGRFSGWISYTYSKTERKIKGRFLQENINSGNYFPSNYDIPNKISVVSLYNITERLNIAANFTYNTGRPATYPDGRYIFFGIVIPHYSSRNQDRLPDYHRLDLAVTLKSRPHKRFQGEWVLSVYNVYDRRNAYSIFLKPVKFTTTTESYQLSIFGSVFPSLSYNFKF